MTLTDPQTAQMELSSEEFDRGSKTAAPNVLACMTAVKDELLRYGIDMQHLDQLARTGLEDDAPQLMKTLHDNAAILFLQWKKARQNKETNQALALARLVNSVTHCARVLNERFDLISTDHIQRLAIQLKESQDNFDPTALAEMLETTAQEHTHERAWPWVVLPTFPRQPYGRILLLKVTIEKTNTPIFVTQPFFLSGKCTLFHTHGQNWATSRPLGNGSQKNKHINTLWIPRSPEDPFPLVQLDCSEYKSGEVAIIPPRLIHGISKKRGKAAEIPSLSAILSDNELKTDLIAKTRFGEMACLHIYYPHQPLVNKLANSPLLKKDERFFLEYDMIVFDHFERSIWSGGGGSWPKRMIEFGPSGEHCGICFENDARRENLDPRLVSKWFVADPPPDLIMIKSH